MADEMAGTNGESTADLAAIGVDDSVSAQLAEQVDDVIDDGAASEEVSDGAADVAELVGGAGVGLLPRLLAGSEDCLLIHTGSLVGGCRADVWRPPFPCSARAAGAA